MPPARQPNSVAVAERWDLNGLEQSVVIRARDVSKPALLWAGDFLCETPPLRHFNCGLEDHFLGVYWYPRYSGQSIDPFAPLPKTLTLAQYAADIDMLIDRVRAGFHKDKVILVDHSSGTNYGLIYAAEHPDKLIAYVSTRRIQRMDRGTLRPKPTGGAYSIRAFFVNSPTQPSRSREESPRELGAALYEVAVRHRIKRPL